MDNISILNFDTDPQVSDLAAATKVADVASANVDPFAGGQTLSTGNLDAALASARQAYLDVHDRAADAAARAFVVWYWCNSAVATVDMKAAYTAKREQKNADIIANNKHIAKLVADTKTAAEQRETWLKAEFAGVNDPTRKAELEEELAGHQAKLQVDIATHRARRLTKVNERGDAANFTEEVKFTLDLIVFNQAAQVNRYANAVGWIHDTLFDKGALITQQAPDAAAIARSIVKNGGVEKVAQAHREARRDADEAEDRRLITEGVAEKVKEAWAAMAPLAVTDMEIAGDDGGMMTVLARKRGKTVEIVDIISVPTKQLDTLALNNLDAAKIAGDAAVEFVAELLTAAQDIVDLVLVCRGDGHTVATFCKMQDGAPVVYATPKNAAAKLLPQDVEVMLDSQQVVTLAKRIGTDLQRKLVSIQVADDPGMIDGKCPVPAIFAWQSVNEKLAANSRATAAVLHQWTDLQHLSEMPHEAQGFVANMTVEITRAALVQLCNGQLKAWGQDQAATKSTQVMTLHFSGTALTLQGSKGADLTPVKIVGKQSKRDCSVSLHPRGLSSTFKMLQASGAEVFTIAPDTSGAVKISWETNYGSYTIYLPLCREGRKYVTRSFAPMR